MEHHIQIFTDGGMLRDGVLSSGGRIFFDKKLVSKFIKTNTKGDIVFAELFAINKGLSRMYGQMQQRKFRDEDCIIDIYTDSMQAIKMIEAWDSELEPINYVGTDRILAEICMKIRKTKTDVRFFHIKSHLTSKNIHEGYNDFCELNNVNISRDEFLFIRQQNTKCDKLVRRGYDNIC